MTMTSNVRPLAAERLAAQLPSPCRNQAHGCGLRLAWAERQRHEAEVLLSAAANVTYRRTAAVLPGGGPLPRAVLLPAGPPPQRGGAPRLGPQVVVLLSTLYYLAQQRVRSWSQDFIHHKLTPASSSFSSSISTATYLHSLQDQQNWWWGPQCIRYQVLLSRCMSVT